MAIIAYAFNFTFLHPYARIFTGGWPSIWVWELSYPYKKAYKSLKEFLIFTNDENESIVLRTIVNLHNYELDDNEEPCDLPLY